MPSRPTGKPQEQVLASPPKLTGIGRSTRRKRKMAVEINEEFLDFEVRGGDGHLAAELLRDVAAVHAGGSAPIPDLGLSFLGVDARWPEHREGLPYTGRHHRPDTNWHDTHDNPPHHPRWHDTHDHRPHDPRWHNTHDNRPNDPRWHNTHDNRPNDP